MYVCFFFCVKGWQPLLFRFCFADQHPGQDKWAWTDRVVYKTTNGALHSLRYGIATTKEIESTWEGVYMCSFFVHVFFFCTCVLFLLVISLFFFLLVISLACTCNRPWLISSKARGKVCTCVLFLLVVSRKRTCKNGDLLPFFLVDRRGCVGPPACGPSARMASPVSKMREEDLHVQSRRLGCGLLID